LAPGKVDMQITEPGYLRPVQSAPLSTSEEAAIAAVCPGLSYRVSAEGRTDTTLWGPYVTMQTGWSPDAKVRFAGSSGGALSMMLIHLLETGAIDAVVQTTASPSLTIGNATVVTADIDAVTAAAGSRYAPSAPLDALPEHLASGKRFAFVGKPCDAGALRALRDRDPQVASAFPVILSFFCAGVPSHTGGREVLAALGTDLEQTAAFRFRGNGWPGQATATAHDGTQSSMSYHDSWGKILTRHIQHRCKVCADGTGMLADIVCADAWESDENGYPVFDEADGISLIVGRTPLGADLIAQAQAAGRIELRDFDISTLADMQPGQRLRRRMLFARLIARRMMGFPIPRYRGLHLRAAARQDSLRNHFKTFVGMARRSLPKRR